MTLLQFIKSKLEEDSQVGDVARDSQRDQDFKELKTDEERLQHLKLKCSNVREAYDAFKYEFKLAKTK
jgi:hypothetical protein